MKTLYNVAGVYFAFLFFYFGIKSAYVDVCAIQENVVSAFASLLLSVLFFIQRKK